MKRVMEIEPNEHRISRFQWKYSYHTHLSENPERPNYAVSTSGKKVIDLQKASSAADFLQLSKDGRSNKESDWIRVLK